MDVSQPLVYPTTSPASLEPLPHKLQESVLGTQDTLKKTYLNFEELLLSRKEVIKLCYQMSDYRQGREV